MTKSKIIQQLSKLIAIQSTNENPGQKLEILKLIEKQYGSKLNVKKYVFQNRNSIVLSNTKSKKLDLIIATHADVVPAEPKQFALKQKGDKLFGRGSADMKAALLMSLEVLNKLTTEGSNKKVAVFVTTDEETDGLSTKYLLSKVGYKSKFAIVPDGGSEVNFSVSQKGFVQLDLTLKGKSSHASRPWEGINPITRGFEIYSKINSKYPIPKNIDDWKTSCVLTKVQAGFANNQVPDTANFVFDVRFVNQADYKNLVKELKYNLAKGDKVKIVAQNESFAVDSSNQYITLLAKSAKKIANKKVKYVKDASTSDALYFAQAKIPSVLFSPTGSNSHQNDEWVSYQSMLIFYETIVHFLKNM
jgi:succinyl-diaminopimelate desuccinylase